MQWWRKYSGALTLGKSSNSVQILCYMEYKSCTENFTQLKVCKNNNQENVLEVLKVLNVNKGCLWLLYIIRFLLLIH